MTTDTIRDLITTLMGQDGLARKRAREQLLEIGAAAVPSLLPLLSNKQTYVCWEAAKTLSEIGDPRAMPALVQALEHDDPGIRWMAAEGLIRVEQAGLPLLLEALVEHGGSIRLREGADHILKILAKNENLPAQAEQVLQALHGTASATETPRAAKMTLETMG